MPYIYYLLNSNIYKKIDNYEKPLKLFEQLIQFNNNVYFKLDLVHIYISLYKYKKANEVIEIILNDSNVYVFEKYKHLIFKYRILTEVNSNDLKIKEIKEILMEINDIKTNKHLFKTLIGDANIIYDLYLIYIKLECIVNNTFELINTKQMCDVEELKLELNELLNDVNIKIINSRVNLILNKIYVKIINYYSITVQD